MNILQGGVMVLSSVMMIGALSSASSARTYEVDEYQNKSQCYRAKKIPAIIEVDTRGIPVSGESRSWSGNAQRDGAYVVNQHNDAVYIQTRREVEAQHTTLVPVRCR
jgi:hypothetical protein